MKKRIIYILLFCFCISSSFSQFSGSDNSNWAVGVSLAGTNYSFEDKDLVGGQFIYQIPRVNISKYIFYGITLDAGFSMNLFTDVKYTTFDGVARYDFGTTYDDVVPYVLIGGSIISGLRTTPTLNFGAGNTFWISSRIGINVQAMYKYSEEKFESQRSHVYGSFGLVYSFGARFSHRRLWNR